MCGEEIRAGSFEGAKLGFTSDLFGGYLIREKNTIKICYIVSFYPNEGNVTRFIKKILSMGYNVKVIKTAVFVIRKLYAISFAYCNHKNMVHKNE